MLKARCAEFSWFAKTRSSHTDILSCVPCSLSRQRTGLRRLSPSASLGEVHDHVTCWHTRSSLLGLTSGNSGLVSYRRWTPVFHSGWTVTLQWTPTCWGNYAPSSCLMLSQMALHCAAGTLNRVLPDARGHRKTLISDELGVRGWSCSGNFSFLTLRGVLWEKSFPPHPVLTWKKLTLILCCCWCYSISHVKILLILSSYLLLMLWAAQCVCVHARACVCVWVSGFVGICLYWSGLMPVVCFVCMGWAFYILSTSSAQQTNVNL